MNKREEITQLIKQVSDDKLGYAIMMLETLLEPNDETLEAIREADELLKNPNLKTYTVEEALQELKNNENSYMASKV